MDYLTKYAITAAVPDITAPTIAKLFVNKVFCLGGRPRVLLSDRGKNFLSPIVSGVCEILQSKKVSTSSYHPQSNGLCERFWGSLKQMLRMYIDDQSNWDEMLDLVTYSYNTGARSSNGFSPFELLFGTKPRVPLDNLLVPPQRELVGAPELVQKLAKHLKKIQNTAKQVNDTKRETAKVKYDNSAKELKLKIGDQVLMKIERSEMGVARKLAPFWDGPHRVVYAPQNSPNVILRFYDDPDGKYDKVHVNRLKKFEERPTAE